MIRGPSKISAGLVCVCLLSAGAAAQEKPYTLEELVLRARQNDQRVKAAEAELDRLRALEQEAFWAWFPNFETSLAVAGPTPEAVNDGLGGPPLTPATLQYDLDFGRVGVMVRTSVTGFLPLYTFGKLASLRKAAEQGPVVGLSLRDRARDEAAFQAAQAFFTYQLARQGRAALAETRQQLDDAAELIERLLKDESPQVIPSDRFKLAFYRQQLEARATKATQGMSISSAALRLVAGIKPEESLPVVEEDLSLPPELEAEADGFIKLAFERRPELRAVKAGLIARAQEVDIREAMRYPDLGLVGFFNWAYTTSATRQRSPFALDPYNDLSGGIAVVARQTFDFPQKNARVEQARAELRKLEHEAELVEGAIRLEVKKAHGEYLEAMARAKAQLLAEKNARRWATAAMASFELGTGDTRELVDAFTALAASSVEKLAALYDSRVAQHALHRAIGGTEVLTQVK